MYLYIYMCVCLCAYMYYGDFYPWEEHCLNLKFCRRINLILNAVRRWAPLLKKGVLAIRKGLLCICIIYNR